MAAGLGGPCALPVAREVDGGPASQGQPDNAIRLLAVADAAEVLPPSRLLSVAREIWPGEMMMMSEFAAAQAGEIGLRAIGAGAGDAHMGAGWARRFGSRSHEACSGLLLSIQGLSPFCDPRPVPVLVSNSHTAAAQLGYLAAAPHPGG